MHCSSNLQIIQKNLRHCSASLLSMTWWAGPLSKEKKQAGPAMTSEASTSPQKQNPPIRHPPSSSRVLLHSAAVSLPTSVPRRPASYPADHHRGPSQRPWPARSTSPPRSSPRAAARRRRRRGGRHREAPSLRRRQTPPGRGGGVHALLHQRQDPPQGPQAAAGAAGGDPPRTIQSSNGTNYQTVLLHGLADVLINL